MLVGLGVHVFDLTRFLLRDEAVEVIAMTDGQTERQPLEHIATIALRMSGGAIVQVMCGRMLPDTQNDLALYGSDGRIATKETIWEARLGQMEVVSASVNQSESYEYNYLANFVAELEDFHDALQNGRAPVGHRRGRAGCHTHYRRRHRVGQDGPGCQDSAGTALPLMPLICPGQIGNVGATLVVA